MNAIPNGMTWEDYTLTDLNKINSKTKGSKTIALKGNNALLLNEELSILWCDLSMLKNVENKYIFLVE